MRKCTKCTTYTTQVGAASAPTLSTSLLRLSCATYDRSGRRARASAITSTHSAGEGPSLLLPPPPLLLLPLLLLTPVEGEAGLPAPLVLGPGEAGARKVYPAAEDGDGEGEGGAKQGRRG